MPPVRVCDFHAFGYPYPCVLGTTAQCVICHPTKEDS